MKKWLSMALRLAQRSDHPHHRMAAVVVRSGAVVSCGINSSKRFRHAEIRALKQNLDFKGCSIYIVRSNGRTSRPCKMCAQMIKRCGVETVVFIDEYSVPCKIKAKKLS